METIEISLTKKGFKRAYAAMTIKSDDLRQYVHTSFLPWVEYDTEISEIPDNVLLVPFVANVMPIAWLCDAEIVVDKLDADFLTDIKSIKDKFQKMYPEFTLGGTITATPERNTPTAQSRKSACMFSGGVDSWATLMRHIDEKPVIISVHGIDIHTTASAAWKNAETANKQTATDFDLEYHSITSNFREVLKPAALNRLVKPTDKNWWHAFQKHISIAALATPLRYLHGFENGYVNDGDDDRLSKIRFLTSLPEEIRSKITLRVCQNPNSDGKNCCRCEKCYRTILELVAVNCPGGVERYGFTWNDREIRRCRRFLKSSPSISRQTALRYYPAIQQEFLKNKEAIRDFDKYEWLLKMDFTKFDEYFGRKVRRMFKRVGKTMRRLKRKVMGR